MSRVLNVAEKPSVAKEISNILGNGRPQKVRTSSSSFDQHTEKWTIKIQSCIRVSI